MNVLLSNVNIYNAPRLNLQYHLSDNIKLEFYGCEP